MRFLDVARLKNKRWNWKKNVKIQTMWYPEMVITLNLHVIVGIETPKN